jgi:hypothetical protein
MLAAHERIGDALIEYHSAEVNAEQATARFHLSNDRQASQDFLAAIAERGAAWSRMLATLRAELVAPSLD